MRIGWLWTLFICVNHCIEYEIFTTIIVVYNNNGESICYKIIKVDVINFNYNLNYSKQFIIFIFI